MMVLKELYLTFNVSFSLALDDIYLYLRQTKIADNFVAFFSVLVGLVMMFLNKAISNIKC